MIVDLLLAFGRFIDRLLGNDRPAAYAHCSAWRTPLQLPDGDGPWMFTPPEAPDDLDAGASLTVWPVPDESPMLTGAEAAELLAADFDRSSPNR